MATYRFAKPRGQNRLLRRYDVKGQIIALIACSWIIVQPATAGQAKDILKASGVQGGLIVRRGCGDGHLTAALHANDSLVVRGLHPRIQCALQGTHNKSDSFHCSPQHTKSTGLTERLVYEQRTGKPLITS
jgi:hypothetical protein